jgi:hypothetical protein
MRRFAVFAVAVLPLLLLTTGTGLAGKPAPAPAGQYPDLRAAVPHHFTIQNQQQREFLRFSNMVANTGLGGLRLRPEHNAATGVTTGYQEIFDGAGNMVVNTPVSEFVYHPAHNHWHITAVALFEIRKALDDGTGGRWGAVQGGQSIKTTFCLIDVIKLEGNSNTTDRTYWDCFPDERQGISAGWGDQYHHATEGQQLELTGAPAAVYYLVTTSNPDGAFLETTQTNNTAWTSFRLTRGSNPKITEIAHSACLGALCGEDIPNR